MMWWDVDDIDAHPSDLYAAPEWVWWGLLGVVSGTLLTSLLWGCFG